MTVQVQPMMMTSTKHFPLNIFQQTFASKNGLSQALLLSAVSSLLTAGCFLWMSLGKGTILGFFSGTLLAKSGLFLILSLISGWLAQLPGKDGQERDFAKVKVASSWLKTHARLLSWLALCFFSLILLYIYFLSSIVVEIEPIIPHIWLVVQLVLIIAILLYTALEQRLSYLESLGVMAIFTGSIIKVVSFLPQISSYPFSLDWSEGSLLYDASLFFSQKIYGVSAPLPVLHPSRSLLQSIPFILPSIPLWFHRLWQVFLWLGLTLLGALALARRLAIKKWWIFILFVLWTCLFILQGPVYYDLMLPAVLVIWGYNRNRFWQSFTVIFVASIWAGISRVNWFPVPGLLAATLYFLEEPIGKIRTIQYLLRPIGWIVFGTMVAFATSSVYLLTSGNPPDEFASSFTSPLIWDRLMPGVTYPLGIIPGLLWITFPIGWLITTKLIRSGLAWNRWRLIGLGSILLVLLAGGLVVSVRIGGGANQHNLDAFLLVLLLAGSYIYFDRIVQDHVEELRSIRLPNLVWAFLLVMPFVQTITPPGYLSWPDTTKGQQGVQQLQRLIDQSKNASNDILLIDNRQLITFQYLKGLTLNTNYEKELMMEMAMANNEPYFMPFWKGLKNHQFSLIITEILNPIIEDDSHPFNAENNAWVDYVTIPILQYYEPVASFPQLSIQVLAPKP